MVVDIKNIHKSFKKNYVLKGLDLSIDQGGIWAVLGPNASGKTTLIKTILGMVLPDKGKISINGENILGKWEYKVTRKGLEPKKFNIYADSWVNIIN